MHTYRVRYWDGRRFELLRRLDRRVRRFGSYEEAARVASMITGWTGVQAEVVC